MKINILKECIRKEHSVLHDVAIERIRLYRVSGGDQELQECLDKIDEGTFLQGNYCLYDRSLGIPVLGPYQVIVQVSKVGSK